MLAKKAKKMVFSVGMWNYTNSLPGFFSIVNASSFPPPGRLLPVPIMSQFNEECITRLLLSAPSSHTTSCKKLAG
jgi:hypothetical protein